MATITVEPAAPTAVVDACRIDVAEMAVNTSAAPDTAKYPVQDEVRGYLAFLLGGVEYGRSYVFAGPSHSFMDYIFPTAGSWVVHLKDASNDSDIATQAVTVS